MSLMPSVCPLLKNVYLSPLPIFFIGSFIFLLLSCMSSLEIKPSSEIALASMFSHAVGFLVVLLMVSFAVQKIFILMQSHLFIFLFSFNCPRSGSSEEIASAYV